MNASGSTQFVPSQSKPSKHLNVQASALVIHVHTGLISSATRVIFAYPLPALPTTSPAPLGFGILAFPATITAPEKILPL
jgi:hypothetical protein